MIETKSTQGIPEAHPQIVLQQKSPETLLIDVRRPEEFTGELGHIQGAKLVTLGPDLMKFLDETPKNKEIVFICRSGGRSGQATAVSRDLGFQNTINMTGGMLLWNDLKLPVVRH